MTSPRDSRRRRRARAVAALGVAVAIGGCAGLGPASEADALAAANRKARKQLVFGMARAEARAHMGTARVVPPWQNSRGIGPEHVANPLDSVEFESASGDTYVVDRYVVGLSGDPRCPFVQGHADLTPLIFYDGALVGWDWDYLENALQRRLEPEERSFGFGRFCDAADGAPPAD